MGKRGPKVRPPEERFRALVDTSGGPDACHPFMGHRHRNSDGHGQFNRGDKVLVYAHRYALELHLGRPLLEGMDALHKPVICHTRYCCNPAHLYEGDDRDNVADKAIDGTTPKGEGHWNNKVREADVPIIRALCLWSGFTQREVAAAFGVTRTTIAAIIVRRSWAWVPSSA